MMSKESKEKIVIPAEETEVVGNEIEISENDDTVFVITFNKPYKFEGKEYSELDLSAIEDISASDMIAANKILDRNGSFNFMPEVTLEYACIIAHKVTGYPLEFFYNLPARESIKLKNKVMGFFFRQE